MKCKIGNDILVINPYLYIHIALYNKYNYVHKTSRDDKKEDVKTEELKKEEVVKKEVVVEEQSYIIKNRDVLWNIAKIFNVDWEKLAEYNNLNNTNLIYPNQVIKLPSM